MRRGSEKRVVLHVGAHKTGTTLIQQYLKGHPHALRRRSIRYVSRLELTPLVGWGEKIADGGTGLARLLDDFAADRRRRVLIGSHENICGRPFRSGGDGLYPAAGPTIDALARLVAPFDTTILLTVRPVHELLESYYLQHVNMGGRASFAHWLASHDLTALSWRPLVDRLRATFGDAAVAVADFGAIRSIGSAGYVCDVLRRVGVELPRNESWVRPLNPSASAQGLRLLLRSNAELDDPDDRAAVRGFVQNHFSNATGSRPVLLDADTAAAVRERYAAEYAELTSVPAAR